MRDWEVVLGFFACEFEDGIADDDMMWRDAKGLMCCTFLYHFDSNSGVSTFGCALFIPFFFSCYSSFSL